MRKIRQVQKIRFGKKSGLLTAFIDNQEFETLDPFVLWDHFEAKAVVKSTGLDYHGHSGIDAVSYPVTGALKHHDSAGSHVTLASGDVHIMTSGNGIIHKDTMTPQNGRVESFSLWTALPAGDTEMAAASSCNINADQLPLVEEDDSTTKVIIGSYKGVTSPANYSIPITYLDIMISPYGIWHFVPQEHQTTGFVYIRSGSVYVSGSQLHHHQMATLHKSSLPIEIRTGQVAARLFVVLGQPLGQPFYASSQSVHSTPDNLSKATQNIGTLLATRK
ncbi:pirin family protein [Photobacterium sanctipauli]|uniref:Pirin family protein n=1 Tax=Photobacterium sanctipauli TaxID=1342794 RepID=A0A2T3NNQ8_9GAMM|nr:pirin family protein [Photobacterium sanctipauli]PSW17622.1 pirin family protein [Photobacterium sanctipauli]